MTLTDIPYWYWELFLNPISRLGIEVVHKGESHPIFFPSESAIRAESVSLFPGCEALHRGYVIIGICGQGSGDNYFLDLNTSSENPPVVRLEHEYQTIDEVLEWGCTKFQDRFSDFLDQAKVVDRW